MAYYATLLYVRCGRPGYSICWFKVTYALALHVGVVPALVDVAGAFDARTAALVSIALLYWEPV